MLMLMLMLMLDAFSIFQLEIIQGFFFDELNRDNQGVGKNGGIMWIGGAINLKFNSNDR
jgi:hypothetical protein